MPELLTKEELLLEEIRQLVVACNKDDAPNVLSVENNILLERKLKEYCRLTKGKS